MFSKQKYTIDFLICGLMLLDLLHCSNSFTFLEVVVSRLTLKCKIKNKHSDNMCSKINKMSN